MGELQRRKTGILGGTFDPVHYGHLLIAQSALEEFGLDQVLFLPTGRSPHKSADQVTDPDIRCEMVKLAIADHPQFGLSFMETNSREINYTYRTLQKIHKQESNLHLYFIMGEDSLDDFSDWKNPEEICRQASVLVAVRNETGGGIREKIEQVSGAFSADMHMLHAPVFSVSSREIRERVKLGKSIRYMLPERVEAFIRRNLLYVE